MSLIDNVLVLIDNSESLTLTDICSRLSNQKKQIIASVLGRLTAKNLVEKKMTGGHISYSISKSGQKKINSVLQNIKKYSDVQLEGDNWHLVIFDIPEKQRSVRDAFRNSLISLGFGKLQDSIWVSYHNMRNEVNNLAEILKISDRVTSLHLGKMNIKEEGALANRISWDWENINIDYNSFLKNANSFLVKGDKKQFVARQLVYQFAKNMLIDPKLPVILQPKNCLTDRAFNTYLKLRKYCY